MPNEITGPWHLLYPLFSSILFVIGALFAKKAANLGVNPYTNTVTCNLTLASLWIVVGTTQGLFLPVHAWGPAALIASMFVAGQLCTYLAFQYGDVSLATPILGTKIIFVAVISSFLSESPLPLHIWIAAILASLAVGIVQMGGGGKSSQKKESSRRTILTVILALLSALAFSCFDIGLQHYGPKFGAIQLLATMFVAMGLISCLLIPWTNHPGQLIRNQALVPLAASAVFIAIQAISISYALGQHGDATRVNIIYALRGLWSVLVAWMLNRMALNPEGQHTSKTMWFRLAGAVLLLMCVLLALR